MIPRAGRATACAVAASALFSFVFLVLAGRGLTFFQDDWEYLYRLGTMPLPERWTKNSMEHWSPLFWMVLELKWRVFGMNHDAHVTSQWLLHVTNVYLLVRFLHLQTRDEKIAAMAASVLGLTTHWAEIVWWACLAGWAFAFTLTVGGLVALERYRVAGRTRDLVLATGAVFLAPMATSAGVALAPVLLAEAATLPGDRRRRAVGAIAAAILAFLACYAAARHENAVTRLFPRTPGELATAGGLLVDLVGAGLVGGVFLASPCAAPEHGPRNALVFLGFVAVVATASDREGRRRALLWLVYLACVAVPIALSRWSFPASQSTASRYQYFLTLAGTVPIAQALALARRRWPRGAPVGALVLLGSLAIAHAARTRTDDQPYAPRTRRHHGAFLGHLATAAREARRPLYDATLPPGFAHRTTSACTVLAVADPSVVATFTNARTPESVAPYARDPWLAELAR